MGFFDDLKKSITKKEPEKAPATIPLPQKVHGVSQKTLETLEKIQKAREKKYLGFVIDATGSREASWSRAQAILRVIFTRLSQESGLVVRVVYFGGQKIGDMGWSDDLLDVQRRMSAVECKAGGTQINKALGKLYYESQGHLPENVILIGDSFEEEIENLKTIVKIYRKENIRVFAFYEPFGFPDRRKPYTAVIFKKIAKLTNGVFQEYREGVYLDELLVAVATYAAQGKEGLKMLVAENSQAALTIQKELLQIEEKTR